VKVRAVKKKIEKKKIKESESVVAKEKNQITYHLGAFSTIAKVRGEDIYHSIF